jgi:hypothetical protein
MESNLLNGERIGVAQNTQTTRGAKAISILKIVTIAKEMQKNASPVDSQMLWNVCKKSITFLIGRLITLTD